MRAGRASLGAAQWLSLAAAPPVAGLALLTALGGGRTRPRYALRRPGRGRFPEWRRCIC